MKVEQFYNKNQFIIYGKGETIFQSYNSTIAIIKNGVLTFGDDWNYSKTTMKHLYLFLEDYSNQITDEKQQQVIYTLWKENNKRKALQKAIDENIIVVSEEL